MGKSRLRTFLVLLQLVASTMLLAQQVPMAQVLEYADKNYDQRVKSVQLSPERRADQIPLLPLNGQTTLLLSFDDLYPGSRTLYYTIEHCTANWKSSNLPVNEYLEGFSENRIENYSFSRNTLEKYTHYELSFPNAVIKPKISGNYLLKVYENNNPEQLVLSRRFYVLEEKVNLTITKMPSVNVPTRLSHQRIMVNVGVGTLDIRNPSTDILLNVLQNGRPDMATSARMPTFQKSSELVYNPAQGFEFPGGNEFRMLDLRSMRSKSERIDEISRDSVAHISLLEDIARGSDQYLYSFDANGSFKIANIDYEQEAISSDYAEVTFKLKNHEAFAGKDLYILGGFNNYEIAPENKLQYEPSNDSFVNKQKLKQGVYNYEYIVLSNKQRDRSLTEGNFFQTRNQYNAFFYYHRPGSRWDELIGYTILQDKQ